MASGVTVSYNGNVIHQMPSNGSFKMNTEGVYMEGDVDVVVDVPSGGSTLIQKSITANGTYDATDDNANGYSQVVANVPNSYAQADEGKVVSNGALVAQTSATKTENGTYDTTLNNEIVVNVQGGGGILSGDTAPSASLGNDGDIYVRKAPTIQQGINYVEYLQNDGASYFNTGITGNQNTEYLYDQYVDGAAWGFGARQAAQSRAIVITSNGSSATSDTFDLGTDRLTVSSLPNRRTIKVKNGKLYINGELQNYFRKQSSFNTPNPLLLFGVYNGNTIAVTSINTHRVYRAVIWEAGELVADFIPCLDANNVPCMWNNVAKEYLYGTGGSFTYGNTATPEQLSDMIYVKQNDAWVYVGDADDIDINGITLISKTITENGTYDPADDDADGYSEVTVNVSGGSIVTEIEMENGGFDSNGKNSSASNRIRSVGFIPCSSDKLYVVKAIPQSGTTLKLSVSFYADDDYTINRISSLGFISNNALGFIPPSNANYFRVLLGKTTDASMTIANIESCEYIDVM